MRKLYLDIFRNKINKDKEFFDKQRLGGSKLPNHSNYDTHSREEKKEEVAINASLHKGSSNENSPNIPVDNKYNIFYI